MRLAAHGRKFQPKKNTQNHEMEKDSSMECMFIPENVMGQRAYTDIYAKTNRSVGRAATRPDMDSLVRQCRNNDTNDTNTIAYEDLTWEQRRVVEIIDSGESVFFTGKAGAGKSYTIEYIRQTRASGGTYITGSTGIAAVNIGGTTLHAFAGVGLAEKSATELANRVLATEILRARWTDCRRLIIDEISMIDKDLFDKLEFIARTVRCDDRPFGGIQVIATGDFLQLPPVTRAGSDSKLCFLSKAWIEVFKGQQLLLTGAKRQTEAGFINLIDAVRVSQRDLDTHHVAALKRLEATVFDTSDGILPTKLCPTNASVGVENNRHLLALKVRAHAFMSTDIVNLSCVGARSAANMIEKSCVAEKTVVLKVGAQVMLLKNLDTEHGIVNGSRGVVVAFKTCKEFYTETHSNQLLAENTCNTQWPVVRFIRGPTRLLVDNDGVWDINVKNAVTGEVETLAIRIQVPLKLAWALTIHKSQGQTLDRFVCDLRCFEAGQAYVALSRARSAGSVRISHLDPSRIWCDPLALEFFNSLVPGHDAEPASKRRAH